MPLQSVINMTISGTSLPPNNYMFSRCIVVSLEVSSFSSAVVHCVHLYRNIDFTSDESLHASLGSALLMMDSVCQLASLRLAPMQRTSARTSGPTQQKFLRGID